MDCFDYIFISTGDLAHFISIFSLVSWPILFLAAPALKSTKSMKPNGNISTKWTKVLYFVWEKVLSCTKVKVFLLEQPFRKLFQTSRVIGLITLLFAKLDAEKVIHSWRKYFLVWHFIENQVFTISALFPCFSVFSFFKLMQLFCLVM